MYNWHSLIVTGFDPGVWSRFNLPLLPVKITQHQTYYSTITQSQSACSHHSSLLETETAVTETCLCRPGTSSPRLATGSSRDDKASGGVRRQWPRLRRVYTLQRVTGQRTAALQSWYTSSPSVLHSVSYSTTIVDVMDTNNLVMFVSHEFYAWHLLNATQHKPAGLQLHYSYIFSFFTILSLLSLIIYHLYTYMYSLTYKTASKQNQTS